MPIDRDTVIPTNEPSYTDARCGPKDSLAHFPEPAHFDCRECRRIIRQHLSKRRVPFPAKAKVQLEGPWMEYPD